MDIKKIKLAYTVGVRVAFNNWAAAHTKTGVTEAILREFILMAEAWNAVNKQTQTIPTMDELAMLPAYVFDDIEAAVKACEKADSKRTVDAESKNVKSGESR